MMMIFIRLALLLVIIFITGCGEHQFIAKKDHRYVICTTSTNCYLTNSYKLKNGVIIFNWRDRVIQSNTWEIKDRNPDKG